MSVAATLPANFRSFELPWQGTPEQERRYRRLRTRLLVAVLALAIIVPWLPVPELTRDRADDVPPRLARFVLDREQPRVGPSEPVVVPEVSQVELEPAVRPQTGQPEPSVRPEPSPAAPVREARERASRAGVMPMAQQLAALHDSAAARSITAAATVDDGADASGPVERAVITSRAGESSGGITTAELSRGTGGEGLAGRAASAVSSPVAGLGGGDGANARAPAAGGMPSRSREEIELVFDRNKGAIYALYSRALRSDPTLQGRVVLQLTIAPDGTVTDCEVVSSELGDPELERRLVQRVLMFQFEDRDVAPVTTTKPIEFFPA